MGRHRVKETRMYLWIPPSQTGGVSLANMLFQVLRRLLNRDGGESTTAKSRTVTIGVMVDDWSLLPLEKFRPPMIMTKD